MKYIDLTHTFNNRMPVFPGDSPAELIEVTDVAKDGVAAYAVKTGMHVGTHMDAPAHMLLGGRYLHEYEAAKFIGRGVLVDARERDKIDAGILSQADIKPGEIVIILTGFYKKFGEGEYYKNYPELTLEFAQKLVESKASIVGMDTPSPDRAPYGVHKLVLSHDILIIENLTNLEALLPHPNFEIIALPAKFQTEAAPCRVIAKVS